MNRLQAILEERIHESETGPRSCFHRMKDLEKRGGTVNLKLSDGAENAINRHFIA